MTAPKTKHYFAAVPARAVLDRRLDGGRFQLLGAIALSNRLGEGQGCWRSAATLATMTGLSAGTIKNYIGDLIAWGYVLRQERPGTKTHRSLFVVYDADADRAALNGQPVISRSDGFDSNPSSGDGQPVISRDDPSYTYEKDIGQSPGERNSAEADLCRKRHQAHVGRLLGKIEDEATARGYMTDAERAFCEEAFDASDYAHEGDPVGGMAYRLLQTGDDEFEQRRPPPQTNDVVVALDPWPTGQKKFGPWLAARRNELGVQVRDLAAALGIRPADLYDIETGRVGLGIGSQRKAVAYLRERAAA